MFAYEKISGLDRDALLAVIEPVLTAHRVQGVELIWRTDHRGRVLYITLEPADGGETGITLDVCTEVSRDLSAALDVADVISAAYRLEVGSPGVERNLYSVADYERFVGRLAKVKLREARDGQFTLRGSLESVQGNDITLQTDTGTQVVSFDEIESGNLVLEWSKAGSGPSSKRKGSKGSAAGNGAAEARR